jgi:hypothetical protein
MNRCIVSIAVVLIFTLHGGCRHAPDVSRIEGASSFRIIERPVPPSSTTKAEISDGPFQPTDVLVAAEPVEPLSRPVYPTAALGKLREPMLVGVQIFIDRAGNVSRIGPSLRVISTPGAMSAEFLAAIEEAVAKWRFSPAEKRSMKPVKGALGQDDFWLITRVEKTEYTLDVSFAFTAAGDVTSGLTK